MAASVKDDELTGAPPIARPRRALRLGRLVQLAAGAAVAAALAGVYVSGAWRSNADPECAAAREAAAALAPLARGEVAAFRVAEKPFGLRDIAFNDDSGARIGLEAFRGKVVLLNFWATWCIPCRAEMPALDRLSVAQAGADFAVVAVDLDTNPSANPKRFLSEVGATHLPFYADESTESYGALRDAGRAVGLPTTLILDRRGCALGTMAGPAAWDSGDARGLIAAALAGGPKPKG